MALRSKGKKPALSIRESTRLGHKEKFHWLALASISGWKSELGVRLLNRMESQQENTSKQV